MKLIPNKTLWSQLQYIFFGIIIFFLFCRKLHFLEFFIEMRIGKDFIRFNEFLRIQEEQEKNITKELGTLTLVCRRTMYFVRWHAYYDFGGWH